MATELALVLLALVAVLAFGLALGRSALVNSHTARLRALHDDGERRAGWALRVADDATRLILAAGLGQNVLRLLALGIALGAFGGSPWRPVRAGRAGSACWSWPDWGWH